MMSRTKKKKGKKEESYEERTKRLEKNRKARERHWRRTGVSDQGIQWMKRNDWL